MRVDFFSVVANGLPFLNHHLPIFESLKIPWHWHIYHGISANPFCQNSITSEMHKDGLSIDGTTEALEKISLHPNVSLHQVRQNWQTLYLTERFQRMLAYVTEPTIAWQIDVDEYWTADQIHTMVRMFEEHPEKQAAWGYCRYFVGPHLCLRQRDLAREKALLVWKRVWRHRPGLEYCKHDPPCVRGADGLDLWYQDAFTHEETAAAGLIFNHYAYVTPAQLRFKEQRYGFKGALEQWRRLNNHCIFPVELRRFVPWLEDDVVEMAPAEHWFSEG